MSLLKPGAETAAASTRLKLSVVPGTYAVCRQDPGSSVPEWFVPGLLASITYTEDETSFIVPEDIVPSGFTAEKGWKAIKVLGPLEFSLTGILSSIAQPLSEDGISIFAMSTYDTDYILVQEKTLSRALDVLSVSFVFVDYR